MSLKPLYFHEIHHKMANSRLQPTNCLRAFDGFVRLALTGLGIKRNLIHILQPFIRNKAKRRISKRKIFTNLQQTLGFMCEIVI